MAVVRERWTDERLDDLNARVSDGFARVDEEFRSLRGEMNARFDKVDARFDALQRLMIQVGGGLIGAFLTVAAALVATQL
jgi:hypothetical protein